MGKRLVTTQETAPPALQATPTVGVRHEAFPLLGLSGCAASVPRKPERAKRIPDDSTDSVEARRQVKRGDRVVGDGKELVEKLGNDPC